LLRRSAADAPGERSLMVSPRGGYACESEGCYAILPIELPTHRRIKLEQQVMQQNQ
jgi:hypothetical protein